MKERYLFSSEWLKEWLGRVRREFNYHDELKILLIVLVAFFLLTGAFHLFASVETDKGAVKTKQKEDNIIVKKLPPKEKELPPLVVYVTGAVEKPGIYRLKEGSRLFELLERASPKKNAAINFMNLAEKLTDGQMIYVPTVEEAERYGYREKILTGVACTNLSGSTGQNKKININLASADELTNIPGVGPKTAEKIIEYRKKYGPFKKPEDLLKIEGIGEKKLEKIEEYLLF
jgi:competence protein ComEA